MIIGKRVYGNKITVSSLRNSQDILILSLKNLVKTAIMSAYSRSTS